jgi:hypothetical protein
MDFEIKAYGRGWGGYCIVAIGQGATVNDALRDAEKIVGAPFRPKQTGQDPELASLTIERPDGSRFNMDPRCARVAGFPEALEVGRIPT